jgi:hypothetical protein
LSQTTHQCWHVQVRARTPILFSFGYIDEIMNEKYASTNFCRELPGLVLEIIFVSLFILHVWDHRCNVCLFCAAGRRWSSCSTSTSCNCCSLNPKSPINPQPNPRERGLSGLGFV